VIDTKNLTQAHLIAALQWFTKMCGPTRWYINDADAAKMIDLQNADAFTTLRTKADRNDFITLTEDSIERLSLLLGIWKELQLLAPPELALQMFNRPNQGTLLKNLSIRDFLLQNNSLEAYYED
jgi:hypothetical protein